VVAEFRVCQSFKVSGVGTVVGGTMYRYAARTVVRGRVVAMVVTRCFCALPGVLFDATRSC
jgi:hypothetical protein